MYGFVARGANELREVVLLEIDHLLVTGVDKGLPIRQDVVKRGHLTGVDIFDRTDLPGRSNAIVIKEPLQQKLQIQLLTALKQTKLI